MSNEFQRPTSPPPLIKASRLSRLTAFIIDHILYLIFALFFFPLLLNFELTALAKSNEIPLSKLLIMHLLIGIIFPLIINSWFMREGQTIGKKIMNIYVAKINSDEPLNFIEYFATRHLIAFTLGVIPIISFVNILMIFKEDRRCFHDLIAKTHVLQIP